MGLNRYKLEHTAGSTRGVTDMCVEGWELFGLGARLEEELRVPLDLIPLSPPTRFTRIIESKGRTLL